MTTALGHLVVEGLGSIRHVELDLSTDVTVLIGANGSGKSNLVSALELVSRIWDDSFQEYLRRRGGVDNLLFEGEQTRADRILITLMSGFDERGTRNGYRVALRPDEVTGSGLAELHEWLLFQAGHERHRPYEKNLGFGSRSRVRDITESEDSGKLPNFARYVRPILEGCRVFHFDDVSGHAPVKGWSTVGDDLALRSDAENIAAYLHRVSREHPGTTSGSWLPSGASRLSPTISFSDPIPRNESGCVGSSGAWTAPSWHVRPAMARCVSSAWPPCCWGRTFPRRWSWTSPSSGFTRQRSTCSRRWPASRDATATGSSWPPSRCRWCPTHFDLGEIVVLDRVDGGTEASRPDEAFLAAFLENYSTGNLWEMNLLGGRPTKEGRIL